MTYCLRCKALLPEGHFWTLERCPKCGYDFNILGYKVVVVLCVLVIGGVWFLARRFPREQWGVAWAASAGMFTFSVVHILGDVCLRQAGVPRRKRIRIIDLLAVILALIVGAFVR
jgi:hypothetical protein